MPVRTNEFQRLIAVIQSHLDPGSTVEESAMLPDVITGAKREVDVVVSGHVGGQSVTVSVECQDRSRSPGVQWVEEKRTEHSRLATNVLVLASHRRFTREALRVAEIYGIRCLVLRDIDASAADRLFPDVQSLWGKAWQATIDNAIISVAASAELPAEWFRAAPDTKLFLQDGAELGSTRQFVMGLLQTEQTRAMMAKDARPEHCFVEFVMESPALPKPICVQRVEPLVLRPVERIRVVAKCVVTVDEFPLRHGVFDRLRVAWGTGTILGAPAIVVATAPSGEEPRITLRLNRSCHCDRRGWAWPVLCALV